MAKSRRISWQKCKRRFAVLWFSYSGVIFTLVVVQSIFGHYGDYINDAWSWVLPNLLPSLSLIIGVLVMDTLGKGVKIPTVDKFFFRLSYILSVFYLVLVSLTIFIQPFTYLSAIELMSLSNLWLGPFQGLVSASLGAFFIRGIRS